MALRLAYAIGNHLSGDYDKAISVLDSYLHTQEDDTAAAHKSGTSKVPPVKKTDDKAVTSADGAESAGGEQVKESGGPQAEAQKALETFEGRSRQGLSFEESELRLYRLSLLMESQQWQAALDYVDSVQSALTDSLFVIEQRAELLQRLGRREEAEVYYRRLLDLNQEQMSYHKGLHSALSLDVDKAEDGEALLSLYQSLQSTYPKASLIRRLPLDFTSGPTFVSLLSPYMKSFIRRAIPSLFVDLKPLYSNAEKAQQIEQLVMSFLTHLRSERRFEAAVDGTGGSQGEESPACLLWTLHFAAQHFDHLGQCSTTPASHTHTLIHQSLQRTSGCLRSPPFS